MENNHEPIDSMVPFDALSNRDLIEIILGPRARRRTKILPMEDFEAPSLLDTRLLQRIERHYLLHQEERRWILAMVEWAKRSMRRANPPARGSIQTPKDAWRQVRSLMIGDYKESFWVLLVDVKNTPILVERVAMGDTDSVFVSLRSIFSLALLWGASGVLCFHNHPSQDPTPGPDDLKLTRKIGSAAKMLGIRFLDHLVCCEHEAYSIAADHRMVWEL